LYIKNLFFQPGVFMHIFNNLSTKERWALAIVVLVSLASGIAGHIIDGGTLGHSLRTAAYSFILASYFALVIVYEVLASTAEREAAWRFNG